MKKVVINGDYGGFCLSAEALYLMLVMGFPFNPTPLEGSGFKFEDFPLVTPDGVRAHESLPFLLKDGYLYNFERSIYDVKNTAMRSHPVLVNVVEKLGERANASVATLKIEEVDDNALYAIEEHDGYESIRILGGRNYTAGFQMTALDIPDVQPPRLPPPGADT